MDPAIFLDRDGVVIENRAGYVRTWEDVFIFPQALEALARLKGSPYKIILVTNQAGIGHGLISQEAVEEINRRLLAVIEQAGGRVDGVFLCPHTPQDGCDCRKPRPGLLLQAAQALDLDLSRSLMIGDAITDLQAGQAAGVSQSALVRTGRGAEQERFLHLENSQPFPVFDTLLAALNGLIHESPPSP
jgi:D-glycero-D-manno-heptose 1,7-bisphosphate phosphatase